MCFVNDDCDWTASVVQEADTVATGQVMCDECSANIGIGEFVHTIHMEESEWCKDCENGDCACVGECCQCKTPNLGETFDYLRCEQCDKFLKAIEAAEIEEGCSEDTARPMLPMWDDIQGMGRGDAKRYWKKAKEMFPEMVASGHLGKLWRMAF